MILTSLSQKQPVYINTPEVVYPNPKGAGSIVLAAGERFMVSQSFSQIMAMMAPGTGAQSQPQPQQITQSQRDSGGGVVSMRIKVLEQTVSIDPSTAPSLVTYLTSNSECKALVEYWFKLYHNHFGSYPTIISDKNVGVICACVSKNYVEEAMDILTWQWTSEHYRARFLRDKGILDPASVLSAARRTDNYVMAQQAKLESMQHQTTTEEIRFCPETGEML